MNDRPPQRQAPAGPAGLCDACAHVRLVQSSRGSTFYLCGLSFADPRFPRYPPLPVLACGGFAPRDEGKDC